MFVSNITFLAHFSQHTEKISSSFSAWIIPVQNCITNFLALVIWHNSGPCKKVPRKNDHAVCKSIFVYSSCHKHFKDPFFHQNKWICSRFKLLLKNHIVTTIYSLKTKFCCGTRLSEPERRFNSTKNTFVLIPALWIDLNITNMSNMHTWKKN